MKRISKKRLSKIIIVYFTISVILTSKSNNIVFSYRLLTHEKNKNSITTITAIWLNRIIPMSELVQRNTDIVGTTYILPFDEKDNKDLKGNIVPFYQFSIKRAEYLQKLLQVSQLGQALPQTYINHQKWFIGYCSSDDSTHNEEWIQKVLEQIKLTKNPHLSASGVKIVKEPNKDDNKSFTFSCILHWIPTLKPENFSKFKYHLLLIANDYRNSWNPTSNVAYDMILLEGDSKELLDKYDGTGFLLNTEERKDNHTWCGFYLKSQPFVLPKVEGIHGWSLQLILEDPEDPSNYVYAWHFPIPEE